MWCAEFAFGKSSGNCFSHLRNRYFLETFFTRPPKAEPLALNLLLLMLLPGLKFSTSRLTILPASPVPEIFPISNPFSLAILFAKGKPLNDHLIPMNCDLLLPEQRFTFAFQIPAFDVDSSVSISAFRFKRLQQCFPVGTFLTNDRQYSVHRYGFSCFCTHVK